MEVADALCALGGVARWQELRGHVSWRAIKRAKSAGEVVRDGDAYSLLGTDKDRVLAQRLRGVRSHVTAAAHHGFAVPPCGSPVVHLTIPRQAKRKDVPEGVTLHYRDHPSHDIDGDCTSPLATVIDCLRDESLRLALSVGDSALASGKITWSDLDNAVSGMRGPGSAVARSRLLLLDARAANAFESCTRAILIEAGITGFEPQVTIRHRGRWVGRVDLADRVRRIVIECDGFETHGGRDAFVKDLVRFTLLVSGGWRPLRFTWEQVMFHPDWVLERITETIATPTPEPARKRRRNADRLARKAA